MEKVLLNPPYNLIIHSSPLRETDGRFYHWHIELMPKLTHVAGFEWGAVSISTRPRRKTRPSTYETRRCDRAGRVVRHDRPDP